MISQDTKPTIDKEKYPPTDWIDQAAIDRLLDGETKVEILKRVPSGEIKLSMKPDEGITLKFNCDCEDAIPYCKATCCTLKGIDVTAKEVQRFIRQETLSMNELVVLPGGERFCMRRDKEPPYRCAMQDSETLQCAIYADRPETCREYHCTKHPERVGWLILPLSKQEIPKDPTQPPISHSTISGLS